MMRVLDRKTTSTICGVDVTKVRAEFLLGAMQKLGLETDPTLPIASHVEAFSDWTAENASEIAQCGDCGGESPADMELCPYCGCDGGVIEGELVEPSTALARAPEPTATPVLFEQSEAGLDDANEVTNRLKADIVKGHWRLGKHLHTIHQSGIWKARQGADGKPKYKTFGQYCSAEVQMVESNVYRLIDVALHWDETTVARLGAEKLDLIMRSPSQIQPKMLEAANGGATVRELKVTRKEAVAEYGLESRVTATGAVTKPRPPSATGTPPSLQKPFVPKREMVTMVEIEGEKTFPMVKRSEVARGNYTVPATDIDDAVGFHFLVNDVALTFRTIRNAKGELVGKVTIKRQ